MRVPTGHIRPRPAAIPFETDARGSGGMPHSARLHGRGLFLRRVAAALALVGTLGAPHFCRPGECGDREPDRLLRRDHLSDDHDVLHTAGTYGDAQHTYFQPLVGRLAAGKWILTPRARPRGGERTVGPGRVERDRVPDGEALLRGRRLRHRLPPERQPPPVDRAVGRPALDARVTPPARRFQFEHAGRHRLPERHQMLGGGVLARGRRPHASAPHAVGRQDVVDPPHAPRAPEGDGQQAREHLVRKRQQLLRGRHLPVEPPSGADADRALGRHALGGRVEPEPAQAIRLLRRAHGSGVRERDLLSRETAPNTTVSTRAPTRPSRCGGREPAG